MVWLLDRPLTGKENPGSIPALFLLCFSPQGSWWWGKTVYVKLLCRLKNYLAYLNSIINSSPKSL